MKSKFFIPKEKRVMDENPYEQDDAIQNLLDHETWKLLEIQNKIDKLKVFRENPELLKTYEGWDYIMMNFGISAASKRLLMEYSKNKT